MTDRSGRPRDSRWLGEYGERVAKAWLRAGRCRILASNFRGPRGGEVDLIARDRDLLVFVEVKTRREHSRVRPLDAVDREKQALIRRGADAWLRQLGTRRIPWRFDVIEVWLEDGGKPRINHVRDAF